MGHHQALAGCCSVCAWGLNLRGTSGFTGAQGHITRIQYIDWINGLARMASAVLPRLCILQALLL